MKTYLVGGAVRDLLLGVKANDFDYVVVGATPDDMLAKGFKQVGADFPVFLHPETGDEYALARVERKTGTGYKGFTVIADKTVTLEDDLLRRDLTINSMAFELDAYGSATGDPIDPYGGLSDLRNKVIRHTSDAFAEDPLRVLRVARFTAKMPGFEVHPDTLRLCKEMYDRGMLADLTDERVWLEVYKALDSANPVRFFHMLSRLGIELKQLRAISGIDLERIDQLIDRAVRVPRPLRFDVIIGKMMALSEVGSVLDPEDVKVSTTVIKARDISLLDWSDFRPDQMYERFLKSGSFRNEQAWQFVRDCICFEEDEIINLNFAAVMRAMRVKASQFPALEGKALGEAIKQARIKAL